MRISSVPDLDRYDCLYVAPHAHDAALSCAGRLLWEAQRGLRVLQLTLFDAGVGPRAADVLPADHLLLGLPDARHRVPAQASFHVLAQRRILEDEDGLPRLVALLQDVGQLTRARHIYVPLAVGGHVDHRLAHEAGLRAFEPGAERDVFLYEERPAALVPGAVQVRLAQIGTWLPPAALPASRGASLPRFLLRYVFAPHVRAHAKGVVERLRSAFQAAGEWKQSRAWRPSKALGPRLQPVLHEVVADDAWRAAAKASAESLASLCGSDDRLAARAADYTRRLGASGHAERYWLLLPQREDVIAPHS